MDEWLMPGIPRTIAESPDLETVRRIRASVTSDTGQVVESDLLLDCPFCSGRPYVQVYELDETCVEARVVCAGCHVSTTREHQSWRVWHGEDELTRTLAIGRAISAWNRRVERTCRNVSYDPMGFKCSECGAEDYTSDSLTMWHEGGPVDIRHCPVCGARIVEVSDDDRR